MKPLHSTFSESANKSRTFSFTPRLLGLSLTLVGALALSSGGCFLMGEDDEATGGAAGATGDQGASGGGQNAGGSDGGQNAGGGGGSGNGNATGDASLSFKAFYGKGVKLGFDNGIYSDGSSPVVVMLCHTSDPTCEQPVAVREIPVEKREGNSGLIGDYYGPTVTASDLPAGDYLMMAFTDEEVSRERQHGYQDGFFTRETAWGKLVSEFDRMLAPSPVTDGKNPPPQTVPVTLVDNQTTDLGDLYFNHFHERDISIHPQAEQGRIAVATERGVRIIDLSNFSVVPAGTGNFYEHLMVDTNGTPLDGDVCGLIRGSGTQVWVLIDTAKNNISGWAVPFDVATGQQVTSNVVTFPGFGSPCHGIYHEHNGESYLWVANRTNPTNVKAGLWYANVADIAITPIHAGYVDGDVYKDGIEDLAALNDKLYVANDTSAAPCDTSKSCVTIVDFDPATGAPEYRYDSNNDYEMLVADRLATVYRPNGDTVECPPKGHVDASGMAIARFHDGRNLLFLGQCLEITVWDLTSKQRLDFNGNNPGAPGLDATQYGISFTRFTLSPDKQTLYALPEIKSLYYFNFLTGPNSYRSTAQGDRLMIFPIDLSQGAMPQLDAAFNTKNVDGYDGMAEKLNTPAEDPGIDLLGAYRTAYQLYWARDTQSKPQTFPVYPSFAAANKTIWVRGSGKNGASGLGHGANLSVCSLPEAGLVLWPRGDQPFFPVWGYGNGSHHTPEGLGFDLTPENGGVISTTGIVYVPTQ